MRALAGFTGAAAGLMMIMVGGFIPAAFLTPNSTQLLNISPLHSTLQVSAVLLSAIVLGPKSAVVACIAYNIIGIFFLPIFHAGGHMFYLMEPQFGYLLAFIPAAWVTGVNSKMHRKNSLILITLSAIAGVFTIHLFGFIYILIGSIFQAWEPTLQEVFMNYSIAPIPSQIILCPCVGILGISLRKLLIN